MVGSFHPVRQPDANWSTSKHLPLPLFIVTIVMFSSTLLRYCLFPPLGPSDPLTNTILAHSMFIKCL